MKNIMFGLILSSLVGATAMAHDLKYTLIQDGAKQVATCQGTDLGTTQVDFFKTKSAAESYVVFSSVDEDSGQLHEHILKASVSPSGHDVENFSTNDVSARMVVVGEGTTPMEMTFRGKTSALKVWLKTYGQGAALKTAKLECTLL